MKKTLLSILSAITIMSSTAIAQPTLTATNSNPAIGDVFTLQPYNYVSPGSSGASQTWNFSSITQTTASASSSTCTAVSSSNTATFPGSNIQSVASATSIGFGNANSTAYQNTGVKQGTVNIVYSNPEDVIHYPFTMGNTYSDPFAATFTNAGSTYTRTGTTAVTADGYGTIQLPGATFSNVLRVHFVQTYKDTTYITGFGPYVLNYVNDEYMWYLPGNHSSIFSVFSFTANSAFTGTSISTGANKLVTITSGINDLKSSINSLNFYPNPSSNGTLNLDLNLNENIKYEIVIINNLGQEVFRSVPENGFSGYNFKTFDISKIASGLYNFEIVSDNVPLITKKIIINN